MIYQKDNQYYLKQNNVYFLAEIVVKSHTIAINPTNEYVEELENAIEVDYKVVRDRYINRESTNVGSLKCDEV